MSDRYDELHDGRLSALYRETRDIEPPEWLDQLILNRARSMTESRPAPVVSLAVPRRRPARWAVPLALAATVVLTVGVVVKMNRESGEPEATLRLDAPQSTMKSAAKTDNEATGHAALSPAERGSRTAPSAAPEPSKPLGGSLAAPAPAAPQPPPPLPAAARQRSITSLEQEKKALDEAAPARVGKKAAADQGKTPYSSPMEWLARIAELRRQGRMTEAEASLAEFRRQYPDHPLDAEASPR